MSSIVSIHSDGPIGSAGLAVDPSKWGPIAAGWEAQDASVSGGVVNSWTSRYHNAGGPYVLTGTGTQRPAYSATGWPSAPGKPGVTLDGVDDRLICDAFAANFAGEDTPISVFASLRWNSVAVVTYFFSMCSSLYSGGTPDPHISLLLNNTTPQRMRANISEDSGAGFNVDATAAFPESAARHNYALISPGKVAGIYRDGALISATASELFDRAAHTVDQFTIGCFRRAGSASNFGSFTLGALYIYSADMSGKRSFIERYLRDRWPII